MIKNHIALPRGLALGGAECPEGSLCHRPIGCLSLLPEEALNLIKAILEQIHHLRQMRLRPPAPLCVTELLLVLLHDKARG